MDGFLADLLRPAWWLSVVVVGIAINVVSGWIKPPLDRTVSDTWGWWARRSAKALERRRARVKLLRISPARMLLEVTMENRDHHRITCFLVMGACVALALTIDERLPLVRPMQTEFSRWATALLRWVSVGMVCLGGLYFFSRASRRSSVLIEALVDEAMTEPRPYEATGSDGQKYIALEVTSDPLRTSDLPIDDRVYTWKLTDDRSLQPTGDGTFVTEDGLEITLD